MEMGRKWVSIYLRNNRVLGVRRWHWLARRVHSTMSSWLIHFSSRSSLSLSSTKEKRPGLVLGIIVCCHSSRQRRELWTVETSFLLLSCVFLPKNESPVDRSRYVVTHARSNSHRKSSCRPRPLSPSDRNRNRSLTRYKFPITNQGHISTNPIFPL